LFAILNPFCTALATSPELKEDNLPEGSHIDSKLSDQWDQYKPYMIGFVVLIVAQSGLIAYLLYQRRLRVRSERKRANTKKFEKMVSGFSSEFINLPADSVDSKIEDALKEIALLEGADRSYFFQFNPDRTEFTISHIWWKSEGIVSDQVHRGMIVESRFPWLSQNLTSGQDVIVQDVEILAREGSQPEYEYCREIGIQSFLILPMQVEDSPLCAIGLDAIHAKILWNIETIDRLRVFGEVLTNAIARKHSENKLITAIDEIASLKEMLEAEKTYLQEEIRLEHNFDNIIGQSDALKYVLYQVEQVASTDVPVLILGETGTGKELIARAIHKLSPRNGKTITKLNCAALPANLVESELFGHEKGAFSGAVSRQYGRFELANDSSIFLDEIGEFPIQLQAKLLRVLENGEYERLGSSVTLRSNARVIAATNRDILQAVRSGRFREDLYYRLKVVAFTLPPLRKRKSDIPLLIKWYTDKLSRKLGRTPVKINQSNMNALMNYDWPGNIRELKHMVESALITSGGDRMKIDLPKSETKDHDNDNFQSLMEMERNYITRVLSAKEWKISGENGAAETLQMHPNTLWARMKKFGIRKPN
jgi:transcriptional regulator with GAF, ATPase, and Fis domain